MLMFISVTIHAQDTIVTVNGDKLHGEIKQLDKGVLVFDTDYADKNFSIEWEDVVELQTERTFLIILTDGRRFNGSIGTKPGDPPIMLLSNPEMNLILDDLSQITFLNPVEQTFLGRMDASIELGYTFTKARNQHQFNTRSSLGYTADYWGTEASFDMIRNIQDSVAPTRRTEAMAGFRTFFKKNWYMVLSNNFLQNDEQKLKLRSTTNLSVGNLVINTSKTVMGTGVGLAYNYETFTSDAPDVGSLEGLIQAELNMFGHDDISILSSVKIYPSFTVRERIRSDIRFDIKYDLPRDFFIKFGFSHNFDSRPVEGASKFDYVIQTNFGWEL